MKLNKISKLFKRNTIRVKLPEKLMEYGSIVDIEKYVNKEIATGKHDKNIRNFLSVLEKPKLIDNTTMLAILNRLETQMNNLSDTVATMENKNAGVPKNKTVRTGYKRTEWSKAETKRLLDLIKEGATIGSIAKIMNRTTASIGGRLWRLDYTTNKKKHLKTKKKNRYEKQYVMWTDFEDKQLMDLKKRNYKNSAIGKILKRSTHAVRCRFNIVQLRGSQ